MENKERFPDRAKIEVIKYWLKIETALPETKTY